MTKENVGLSIYFDNRMLRILLLGAISGFPWVIIGSALSLWLKDYELCINLALDNAKKRISLLDNFDKKCVLAEYKEWINDGINKHTVLLLREDPII